jgi:hypothetical protein
MMYLGLAGTWLDAVPQSLDDLLDVLVSYLTLLLGPT